jgi:signal transduction histidine kinase
VAKSNPAYHVKLAFDEMPEEEESLLVFGNEALLLTAIKNIVINACKYAPDHQASVSLNIRDNEIFVSVTDTGPGISTAENEKIFQPFYRIEESRSNTGGFGLGLSLANRIVKIHKGHISIHSTVGTGTTFTIQLPSAKALKTI